MKLDTIKNKGMVIYPGARISNGSKVLSEILETDLMRSTAGVHSIREFENTVYLYIDGEFNNINTIDQMDKVGVKYNFFLLRQVQNFIHSLWSIKDNNIYVRDGFLLAYNQHLEDGCTYKASLSEIFNYSTCEHKESKFSDSEIASAISNFDFPSMEEFSEDNFKWKYADSDHFFKNKGSERIQRANYFTIGARANATLPMKIVSYCTALECLFTIGTAEVNHKIAERVALMLGTSKEAKLHFFNLIKRAYNYRSSIVHGQHIKGTEENLVAISKELDDILRELLVGEHDIFSKSDNEMEAFFVDLLFTNSTTN